MNSSRAMHDQLSFTPDAALDHGQKVDDFLYRAFRAADHLRRGAVTQCELQIGHCSVSIARASTDVDAEELLGSLAVPDSEGIVRRALQVGAIELFATKERLLGAHERCIRDPYGTLWLILPLSDALAPWQLRARIRSHSAAKS
jgi:hypothetical protein